MKKVLVSQRVDAYPDRGERRDALDQRLCRFLLECGLTPVPVPNDLEAAAGLWEAIQPQCVVLSGGNDLLSLGGDAPEREAVELLLLELAGSRGTPVFGICHGLQLMAARGGALLREVEGHVASRHDVEGRIGRVVNSYHRWAIHSLGRGWDALARAWDATIECAACPEARQFGVMWHPERVEPFDPRDIALVRAALEDRAPSVFG